MTSLRWQLPNAWCPPGCGIKLLLEAHVMRVLQAVQQPVQDRVLFFQQCTGVSLHFQPFAYEQADRKQTGAAVTAKASSFLQCEQWVRERPTRHRHRHGVIAVWYPRTVAVCCWVVAEPWQVSSQMQHGMTVMLAASCCGCALWCPQQGWLSCIAAPKHA